MIPLTALSAPHLCPSARWEAACSLRGPIQLWCLVLGKEYDSSTQTLRYLSTVCRQSAERSQTFFQHMQSWSEQDQQVKNRDALTTKTSLSAELTGAFISVLVIYSNRHLFVFSNKLESHLLSLAPHSWLESRKKALNAFAPSLKFPCFLFLMFLLNHATFVYWSHVLSILYIFCLDCYFTYFIYYF